MNNIYNMQTSGKNSKHVFCDEFKIVYIWLYPTKCDISLLEQKWSQFEYISSLYPSIVQL